MMSTSIKYRPAVLALALLAPSANAASVWQGNGHEYAVVSAEGATWQDARAAARALGAGWDLATVTSAAENEFLIAMLPAVPGDRWHYWLGANDSATEGVFAWVTGEAFTYANWAPGEPNDFDDDDFLAVDFRSGWVWNDAPNDLNSLYPGLVRGFVAERTVSPVPEPTNPMLFAAGLAGLGARFVRRVRST